MQFEMVLEIQSQFTAIILLQFVLIVAFVHLQETFKIYLLMLEISKNKTDIATTFQLTDTTKHD